MQRHYSNPSSESTLALGVLGRLMRAFPARAVVGAAGEAEQQTGSTVVNTPRNETRPAQGLLGRIESWIWRLEQRENEAYLAEASGPTDLEARIRALDHLRARKHIPF